MAAVSVMILSCFEQAPMLLVEIALGSCRFLFGTRECHPICMFCVGSLNKTDERSDRRALVQADVRQIEL